MDAKVNHKDKLDVVQSILKRTSKGKGNLPLCLTSRCTYENYEINDYEDDFIVINAQVVDKKIKIIRK